MFDFTNIEIVYLLPSQWLKNPFLRELFTIEVVEETGEVLIKKRLVEYHGLTFKLIPSANKSEGYAMAVSGSLHKYRNKGEDNYDRFTFYDCVEVIHELSVKFEIEPTTAVLHIVEIGVNLNLSYSPQKIIKSAIVHRNYPYEAINKNRRNGVCCVHDRYEVKLYDKGFVCGLHNRNIIRFEFKTTKMQQLEKYGINFLSDLTDKRKVMPLLDLLIESLDDTVFIPYDTDMSSLTEKEKINFLSMRIPSTWKELTPKQRFDKKLSLSRILKKCNTFDYQLDLKNRVIAEWKILTDAPKQADKNVTFAPSFYDKETIENVTFAPLVYKVQTLPNPSDNQYQKNVPKFSSVRRCKSCGKDISMNREGSVFCSVKYNPDAKQCRNKDSNPKNNFRTQFQKIIRQPSLFDIPELLPENRKAWISGLL
ncbi:MAG: hypothetical protein V4585_14450 [Bacteroidota bacterium]